MVKIQNISKVFNKSVALKDITFDVKKNELILLSGKSGSGKSTLLSLIAGLTKPTQGTIIVDDTEITKLPDSFASNFRNKNLGFIFQQFNLIENLSVYDNVQALLIVQNLPKNILKQQINSALKLAKIDHKATQITNTLSGGEQQRVAIARALVNNSNLILADEPTANLDSNLTQNFIDILKELKELGKTIILATHDDIFFKLDIVDKIVKLQDSKVVDVFCPRNNNH